MHALYCNGIPVHSIVMLFTEGPAGAETERATIALTTGDVIDVDIDDLHVADEVALALIAAAPPGRHRLDNADEEAQTVLGIVRRLSVEEPTVDHSPDRARLIAVREKAGYNVEWERLAEVALQDGLAVLAAQAAA